MSRNDAINLAYLVTIVTFILALRFLSSPAHARLGNRLGAIGMAIAIAATFARAGLHNYVPIVKMTAMPPTPLKSATICGIAVIFTARAAYQPTGVNTAMTSRIDQ